MFIKQYLWLTLFFSATYFENNYSMSTFEYDYRGENTKNPYFFGPIRKTSRISGRGNVMIYKNQEGHNNLFWKSIQDIEYTYDVNTQTTDKKMTEWYYRPSILSCLLIPVIVYGTHMLYKKFVKFS